MELVVMASRVAPVGAEGGSGRVSKEAIELYSPVPFVLAAETFQ
jgi:hypothetical protein